MEEPKKLIYDSGEQPEEVFYGSAATWTETACMSESTRQNTDTELFPTLR